MRSPCLGASGGGPSACRWSGQCSPAACFSANGAITGEFNYQGGDRKTFYGRIGFPFANDRETFENIGPVRGRESIMVGDVLANQHTFTVLRDNVAYFVFGRFCGLVPYFFPGVLSGLLFYRESRGARGNGSSARRSSARRSCW